MRALKRGLLPSDERPDPASLGVKVWGRTLPNPVGLAAGFDKNAEVPDAMLGLGFGLVEIGSVTPRAQEGNPRPRLFRLAEDRGVINRMGFPGQGLDAARSRLAARPRRGFVGVNVGANKDSTDRAADFARVLATCGPHVDFATVNVSSPNTEKLRDLQGRAALSALLAGVMDTRASLARPIPIFLKIAPDLTESDLAEIAEVALTAGLAGIIATNTTLSRDGLQSPHRTEAGGLSGAPLFEKSTRTLARLSQLTDGRLPLIGVGGVSTPEQAWEKIRAGANAVQVYTAMVYQGLSLIPRLAQGLDAIAAQHGFAHVTDATGTGRDRWL